MEEQLRREDLEALGSMASLVGTYMNDFASRTDGSERRNLFKGGINPKATVANAVKTITDDPARRIISNNSPIPIQPQNLPPPPPSRNGPPPPPMDALRPLDEMLTQVARERLGVQNIPIESGPQLQQLEFGFVNQKITSYGSVGDVIKHFNSRLDNLEESIKLMKTFIVDVRATMDVIKSNMPKRKNAKNASEKIT